MKESVKNQTDRAFQVGGYNPPAVPQATQPYAQPTPVNPQTGTYTLPGTGISGYQIPSGQQTGYIPYGGVAPTFVPTQFTGPQYQTALQTTNLPTFAETVGSKAGQYDELRTYVNDAGQTLQIPFKDGKPIYPIPEGYKAIGEQRAPEEEQTTVTPTVGTTTVTDQGGGDDRGSFVGTGYKGLSTSKVSGGLTEASAKAKADLGITGFSGHSVGSMMAFAGSALGIPGSMGLAGKESMGFIGAVEPTQGYTGTISQPEMYQIANLPKGFKPAGYNISQEIAENVLEAQAQFGVEINGKIGYQTGNISPNYGTAVKNGMTINSGYGGNQPEYASVRDMVNTIEKGMKSGWRGGYVDKSTYDNLSTKAKQAYDNFDNTHKGYDIISKDPKALAAYQKGNMPQDNQITGTPTSIDAAIAKSMADKAFAKEQKAFEKAMEDAGKPDVSGATPADRSQPSNPVGALEGGKSGPEGYGGGDQAGQAGDTGPSADAGAPD